MNIVIDQQFKSLIPPLTADELGLLELSILAEGCRDPLVVWNGVLVDGHNRHEICARHGIPFQTVFRDFTDRDAAMDWIDVNQLGRRNLSRDWFMLLLGRRYNRLKKGKAEMDQTSISNWVKKTKLLLSNRIHIPVEKIK